MPKKAARKEVVISAEREARYIKELEKIGGQKLVAEGHKVLAHVRAGKKVSLPKGKIRRGSPKVAVFIDPLTAAGTAACLASCLKHVNPWHVAGCVFLCLATGTPPV